MSAKADPRVYVVLLAKERHMLRRAGIAHGKHPEEWACRCGVSFTGDGSIENGRKHDAEVIIAALDEYAQDGAA